MERKRRKKKKEKEANENARQGLLNALAHLKGTPAEKVILYLLNLEDVNLEELLSQLKEYLGVNEQTSVMEDTYGENVQTQTRLNLAALTKEQLSIFADALGAKLELQAQVREQTKLKKQLREIYEKMGEPKKARDVQLSVIQEVYQNLDEYEKLGELYEKVQDKGVKAFVNGVQPAFEVPPIIKDNRTLVPFRAIAEALGAEVKWDAETRTVTVSKGDATVQLTIGSNVALVNGQEISLDVPASIIQGRTLVPARFLANALGAKVDWVPIGQIVVINASPDSTTTK